MVELEFHNAAEHFPMLDSKRAEDLREDIISHGQRETIKTLDGKILDGRNRYKACVALGITPKLEALPSDTDPWAYAWSLNGERRDLTADQRYLLWKSCTEQSAAWAAKRQAAQDEANRARSAAAVEQHKVSNPRVGESVSGPSTSCGQTKPESTSATASPRGSGSASKATASKTNRGAVERMDKLSRDRPDLAKKVQSGELKSAAALREMKKDAVADTVAELPKDKFRVIYADPPWKYNDAQGGSISDSYGGAEKHYPSMTLTEICALQIEEMAQENAVLFLWVTSPLLPDGFKVASAWGFKYKSAFIWDKVRHNMGHYNSVRHELLLICTKGSCTPDVAKLFDSVQSIERTDKHSEKPEKFREIIDTLYPHGRRIELFRRGAAPNGWDVWGNESGGQS